MKGKEARDSATRVIDLISEITKEQKERCLLSTDAEKAFDRVDWTFMMQTLEIINVGINMINWILSLYTFPRAQIRVNSILSHPFDIRNLTRQGCPLSPLLFILSLELFLKRLRGVMDIAGIKVNKEEHKVSAYADNLLFSIRNPNVTVSNLIKASNSCKLEVASVVIMI